MAFKYSKGERQGKKISWNSELQKLKLSMEACVVMET